MSASHETLRPSEEVQTFAMNTVIYKSMLCFLSNAELTTCALYNTYVSRASAAVIHVKAPVM